MSLEDDKQATRRSLSQTVWHTRRYHFSLSQWWRHGYFRMSHCSPPLAIWSLFQEEEGEKKTTTKNQALLNLSLFFFLFQRFTAWAKIINIWPTEQLVAAEKFCLHVTRLGFQQRGGALETKKFILGCRTAGEQRWRLVFRMIDHFKNTDIPVQSSKVPHLTQWLIIDHRQ